MQQALYNSLGPGGLNLLVLSAGSDGTLDYHDVPVTASGDQIQFDLHLKKTAAMVDTTADPLKFDIGIPGLGPEGSGECRGVAGL